MAIDRHAEYLGLWIAFGALSTLALVLRFYVRMRLIHEFGYDDYVLILAAAWNTLLLISGYLQSHYGMGHHFLDLPKESAVQAIKWQILGIPIANFCMACVKLSLCLLLVRIGLEKTWKWILCSLIGTLVVDTVVDTVVFLRRCTPLPSMWDLSIPNVCHYSIAAVNISHYVQIALAICTDILLSLAPALMLLKLRMRLGTKLLLIGLFCLGLMSTVCSVLKVVYTTTITNDSLKDFTYAIIPVSIWAFLECELSIIAVCIPQIRTLFTRSAFFQSSYGAEGQRDSSFGDHTTAEPKHRSDIKVVTSVEWTTDGASEEHNPYQYSLRHPSHNVAV